MNSGPFSGWFISRCLGTQSDETLWEWWPCKAHFPFLFWSFNFHLRFIFCWFLISVEGFSISDRRILYEEGKLPRICTAFRIQCRDFTEVSRSSPTIYFIGTLDQLLTGDVFSFIKITFSACFRVGRKVEAKDAARGALKSPWWTLGCKYHVWTLLERPWSIYLVYFPCFQKVYHVSVWFLSRMLLI